MSLETQNLNPDLGRLQRWMQEVVVHPGTVEEAIASPGAEREIPAENLGEVVLPSDSMTSEERVGVYHGMYLMRMEEALETDYAVLRYRLGPEAFSELVEDYVQRFPSRSYTLNRLGDHLPQFLADEEDRPDAEFLHDLARLELAMTQVFDEQEAPVLGAEDLEAVAPEAWETAVLRPIPAFRLLAFKHAVIPDLIAYHEDRPSPRPRWRATWVALYRHDYSVLRLELSRAEFDLLKALAGGTSLGEALATAALKQKSTRQRAQIFKWFRTWVAAGLFTAIDT
ncbi:MAG: putative DNA-binding domain-containing protein [Thermoanaerobaculales bacterium]